MTNKKEKMWDIKDRNESPIGRRQNMSEEEIKARENKSYLSYFGFYVINQ